MKRTFLSCSIFFVAAALSLGVPAQGLKIQGVSVTDNVETISCAYQGELDRNMKGNLDGTLSPGERDRLTVSVMNNTGYDITDMYAVMYEDSSYLNVISPNCYGGTGGGGIGVRYIELGSWADGTVMTNFDPFVVEVSQDLPCEVFAEFGITFYYTTSGGGCAAQCSESHKFKLPVFSFDRPFLVTPEREIFDSANDQPLLGAASSGIDLGFFYSSYGGLFFSKLNLDGTVIDGPKKVSDILLMEDTGSAIWNRTTQEYQLIKVGPFEVFPATGYGAQSLFLPGMGTATSVRSIFYDEESLGYDSIVAVVESSDMHIYVCRYRAESPYQLVDYADLGVVKTQIDRKCYSSIGGMYDHNLGFYDYFVAYEYHDDYSNIHTLKVAKLSGINMVMSSPYEIAVDPDPQSKPSLAVDNDMRTVGLAFQKKGMDLVPRIYGIALDRYLMPVFPYGQMTDPEPGRLSADPVLVYDYGDFYLISRDASATSMEEGSKIKVEKYSFTTDHWPLPSLLHSSSASAEWLHMENLKALLVFDKLHIYWQDTRGSFPNSRSIHTAEARTLDPRVPYNLDVYDDELISQPYEISLHPTAVCKDSECMVAWVNSDLSDSTHGDIYYRLFYPDGSPIGTTPVPVTFSSNCNSSTAHPVSGIHDGYYELFWMEYDTSFYQNALRRWSEQNYTPSTLLFLESPDSRFMDAVPCGYAGDLLLVTDKKSGDLEADLYAEFCNHYGGTNRTKLTSLSTGNYIASARAGFLASGPYPFAVAWLERDYSTSSSTLRFAYLDYDYTVVPGYPAWLESWPNMDTGEFSMSVNTNMVSVLFSFESDLDTFSLQFRNYPHPLDRNAYQWSDVKERKVASNGSNPFVYPQISWNGLSFDYSWVEQGSSVGSGSERLFWSGHLDEYGSPMAWPTRVGSYLGYMVAGMDFNYQVVSSKYGTLAVYTRGSGSHAANIHLTGLSWDPSSMVCSLYNTAPVVTTTGPYVIEYGSGVALGGSAADDVAMGDYVASAGWDITGDGVVDFNGLSPVVSFDQLKQKGWVVPRSAGISLKATDRQGLSGTSGTTLTVRDTTAPSVSLVYPNGGETLRAGGTYTVLWTASDNYLLDYFNVYYCTDWNGTSGTWVKINGTVLPGTQRSLEWTVPESLSSTCRVKVEAVDKGSPSANTSQDPSDTNFYIVQATTSSIKTLILRSVSRLEQFYPGQSSLVGGKLAKLMVNGKVNGFIVEVDSIPGLPGPGGLYEAWDLDPTDQSKANAVANAIRDYVKGLVRTEYTNVEYLVIVGDDRMVPFYRVVDGTPGSYSENDYAPLSDCSTMTGSALCQNYYLTDNIYGDIGYWNGESWEEYDPTGAGVGFMALPDLSIGRLVESPEQMGVTIDAFITMDGQVTLDSLTEADVLVTGYDFLTDSATAMYGKYDVPYVVDGLLEVEDPPSSWTGDELEAAIFVDQHTINSINGHCTHYTLESPDRPLSTSEMSGDYPGESLKGRVFYNVGCHSGLNVPSSFAQDYDLPEMMMEKGAIAYVGNTGFGWGLKHGSGYTEKLMELVTDKMLSSDMISLGQALSQAKREYFVQDKRYDVFDEKVLFESTLYGLPMYRIVMSQQSVSAPRDFSGPEGPDEEELNGIKLKKRLSDSGVNGALPAGVTELSLNFEFGPGTHQLVHTADGDYYKLNGRVNAEAGDSLQPLFVYESRLSGVVSHGVVFTGGTFSNETPFSAVIGTPQSSSPVIPPEPIAPIGGAFIPTVNVSHPQQPSSLISTDLTKLTVYTGYYEDGVQTLFGSMGFSVYYSNSSDKTAPLITDPGAGVLHTLSGTVCTFSVQSSDAGSGMYRVIVTYTDHQSKWQSLDLANSAGTWTGSLDLRRDITYFVQAVDNAGNVKVLKTNEGRPGFDPATGLPWVVAARMFDVELLDADGDEMEDTWEAANGLNTGSDDSGLDPDWDGLTNGAEFDGNTLPQDADTDGDGDNDGSELADGRDPLSSSDGKWISITVTKDGNNDSVISWPDGLGDNSRISGYYWVYRSADPFFDETEILTAPPPLPDATKSYTDVGSHSGGPYYYQVVNARFEAPAPVVNVVYPASGPEAGNTAITVYGEGFSAGAKVRIGGVNAASVMVVNSTTITCRTPAGTAGAKDVTVTNLNGQFGTLVNGFTYY